MNGFRWFCITTLFGASAMPTLNAQKIGVVDTSRVLRSSKFAARVVRDLTKKREASARQLQILTETLRAKTDEQKQLTTRGSPEWREYEVNLGTLRAQLDGTSKLFELQHGENKGVAQLAIRQRIVKVLRPLCEKRGIDLVIKTLSVGTKAIEKASLGYRRALELQVQLDSPLLFYSKRIDLTNAVIQLMDIGEKAVPAEASARTNGAKKPTPGKPKTSGNANGSKDSGKKAPLPGPKRQG